MGDICLNWVAGIAYLNLRKMKKKGVSSEFIRALNRIYDSNGVVEELLGNRQLVNYKRGKYLR